MLALLQDRAVVRLSGPDRRSFLHGLITQDVESLEPGGLRYGALLTPQGRLRFDLFLHGENEAIALDVAADAQGELVQALTLYRLRAKVEIAAGAEPVLAAWGEAPAGEGWRADPRLPGLGWRKLSAAAAAGAGDYHAHARSLGVADPAVDAVEPLYPIEANLDLLNGIDFRKGCFVGQETTSRMKRRGPVKTRIAPIVYDGPPLEPGQEVMAGELRAGRVLSGGARPSGGGRSLALLRIDRSVNAPLAVGNLPVRLELPPWLQAAFTLENARADA
jgi:tRNA-modifying protein YgfZ